MCKLVFLNNISSGHCGHGSPCDQLCYQLHDGMYECDCTDGFELDPNGYSCRGKDILNYLFNIQKYNIFVALNTTFEMLNKNNNEVESNQIDEDVIYQKSMSFSAHLEGFNNLNAQNETEIMDKDNLIVKNQFIEKDDVNVVSLKSITNSSVTLVNSSISTQTTATHLEMINIGYIGT